MNNIHGFIHTVAEIQGKSMNTRQKICKNKKLIFFSFYDYKNIKKDKLRRTPLLSRNKKTNIL